MHLADQEAFIQVKGLTRYFGGLGAVKDFDLSVSRCQIMGLIGPNGAGKSTVLNMIAGSLRPTRGTVIFKGNVINRLPAHQRARLGISRLYQANVLFNYYTAADNILVGLHLQADTGLFKTLLRRPTARRQEKALYAKALSLLDFVGIADYAHECALNLPHGIQRRLSLALALAVEPELILLDEPFTGMTDGEVKAMMAMIAKLKDQHQITFIVIEHNLRAVMNLCDRIAVLNFGEKLAEGTPREILADPAVSQAYLGAEGNAA